MSSKEIWSPIKEYEGYYAISNFGNVKSVERKVKNRNGYRIVKERLLKPSISNKGYYLVALSKNGKLHTFAIHKMVMEHFNRCAFDYEIINHIDHNKLNNNISNLEYITQKENVKDAWDSGLCENARRKAKINILKASESKKIKVNQYDLKGSFIKQWNNIREIQYALNINNANIVACCKEKRKTAGGYIWRYTDEISTKNV